MSNSHYIPLKSFKALVYEADKLDYDIHIGAAMFYLNKQEGHLASPLSSDVIKFSEIDKILYTPSKGVYSVTYNDGGKLKKKAFTFKKRLTTELISAVRFSGDNAYMVDLIKKNHNRYTILVDNNIAKYSEKMDALILSNKKRLKLSDISKGYYHSVDNVLTIVCKDTTYTLRFMTDFTGSVLT